MPQRARVQQRTQLAVADALPLLLLLLLLQDEGGDEDEDEPLMQLGPGDDPYLQGKDQDHPPQQNPRCTPNHGYMGQERSCLRAGAPRRFSCLVCSRRQEYRGERSYRGVH